MCIARDYSNPRPMLLSVGAFCTYIGWGRAHIVNMTSNIIFCPRASNYTVPMYQQCVWIVNCNYCTSRVLILRS